MKNNQITCDPRERTVLGPSDETACSVAVLLKPREIAALDGLCTQKDMTRQSVMLAALRLYQAVTLGAAKVTWNPTGLPVGCMGDDCPPNVERIHGGNETPNSNKTLPAVG